MLVSLGPGEEALIPPLARDALAASELVVGLDQYVDRVRHLLRPGTEVLTMPLGDEVARAEAAIAEARSGGAVSLVSSGDVGVYAMASPALELAGETSTSSWCRGSRRRRRRPRCSARRSGTTTARSASRTS